MFVSYSYIQSTADDHCRNIMHVYDLSNDQFMNTYEIKDTLENVEFEKILPYPKGCN